MKFLCQTPIVPATPVASALPTLISANQKTTSGPSGHKHLGKCLSRQADVKCKTSEARLSLSDALPDIYWLFLQSRWLFGDFWSPSLKVDVVPAGFTWVNMLLSGCSYFWLVTRCPADCGKFRANPTHHSSASKMHIFSFLLLMFSCSQQPRNQRGRKPIKADPHWPAIQNRAINFTRSKSREWRKQQWMDQIRSCSSVWIIDNDNGDIITPTIFNTL